MFIQTQNYFFNKLPNTRTFSNNSDRLKGFSAHCNTYLYSTLKNDKQIKNHIVQYIIKYGKTLKIIILNG